MKFKLKWLFVIIPLIIIIALVILVSVTSKDEEEEEANVTTVEYVTKDNRVTFTFNSDYEKKEVGDYDLYASKNDVQIFGAFTYTLSEYEENSSSEILNKQLEYFLTSRNNMQLFKKETVTEEDDKTITRIEYEGNNRDTSDCIYIFSVIDFKADSNYVVYVNEVIIKSDYEDQIGEMIDILKSAKLN